MISRTQEDFDITDLAVHWNEVVIKLKWYRYYRISVKKKIAILPNIQYR